MLCTDVRSPGQGCRGLAEVPGDLGLHSAHTGGPSPGEDCGAGTEEEEEEEEEKEAPGLHQAGTRLVGAQPLRRPLERHLWRVPGVNNIMVVKGLLRMTQQGLPRMTTGTRDQG
jgi:hypothetical protein